jgi:hypothetical protein
MNPFRARYDATLSSSQIKGLTLNVTPIQIYVSQPLTAVPNFNFNPSEVVLPVYQRGYSSIPRAVKAHISKAANLSAQARVRDGDADLPGLNPFETLLIYCSR